MRPKFRVWDKFGKRMLYLTGFSEGIFQDTLTIYWGDNNRDSTFNGELMQFTGLPIQRARRFMGEIL